MAEKTGGTVSDDRLKELLWKPAWTEDERAEAMLLVAQEREAREITPEEAQLLVWLMGHGDRPGGLLDDDKAHAALLAKLRALASSPSGEETRET